MVENIQGDEPLPHLPRTVAPVFTRGAGFWIAPSNYFFCVTRHIEEIVRYPHVFGTTSAALAEVFERYNEPLASERAAREVIIVAIVQQLHWIRVRHYNDRRAQFSFNLPALDQEAVRRVIGFFQAFAEPIPDFNVRLDHPGGQILTSVREGVAKFTAQYLRADPSWAPPSLRYISEHDAPVFFAGTKGGACDGKTKLDLGKQTPPIDPVNRFRRGD